MSGNQEKITRHTKRQKIQFEETKEAQEPNTAGMLELSASRGMKGLNAVKVTVAGKSLSEKVSFAMGNFPSKVTF